MTARQITEEYFARGDPVADHLQMHIEAATRAKVAEEREACVAALEARAIRDGNPDHIRWDGMIDMAIETIRARGHSESGQLPKLEVEAPKADDVDYVAEEVETRYGTILPGDYARQMISKRSAPVIPDHLG